MSKQLIDAVLDGQFYLVGEYRGGYVGKREFVDKNTGKAVGKVSVRHLIEICGSAGVDSVTVFESVPLTVIDPATVKIPWVKGKRYAFPLVSLAREKGKTSALLDTSREVIPL